MKKEKLILIGSSTGGPGHLEKILSSLRKDLDATVIIAQHIEASFIPSMVKRFNDLSPLTVYQAKEKASINTSEVIFCHEKLTDVHLRDNKGFYLLKCSIDSFYRPSIDSLFHSASKLMTDVNILACLLTGIGDDGAKGLLALKQAGALCIAESEDTAIVYGMPKVAKDLGACSEVLPLDQIISRINTF